jgi:hypothetical protein
MWDSVAYDFGDAMLRLLIVAQTLGHDDIRFTAVPLHPRPPVADGANGGRWPEDVFLRA